MTKEEPSATGKDQAAADACYAAFKAAIQPLARAYDVRLVVMSLTEIASQIAAAAMGAGYLPAPMVAQWFSDALADTFTRKDVAVGTVTVASDSQGAMQ